MAACQLPSPRPPLRSACSRLACLAPRPRGRAEPGARYLLAATALRPLPLRSVSGAFRAAAGLPQGLRPLRAASGFAFAPLGSLAVAPALRSPRAAHAALHRSLGPSAPARSQRELPPVARYGHFVGAASGPHLQRQPSAVTANAAQTTATAARFICYDHAQAFGKLQSPSLGRGALKFAFSLR